MVKDHHSALTCFSLEKSDGFLYAITNQSHYIQLKIWRLFVDTGTHFVMGLALGGLAMVDPAVSASTVTSSAILIATVIGSEIPDIDTVLKLRNNANYIRHHRGVTHSIPAIIGWPFLIVIILYPFFPEADFVRLWLWSFLAVFLHVSVDIFNAYGTQALRPFSTKWIALGWINTFDLFIFVIHLVAIILWGCGYDPGKIFPILFMILIVYYFYRYYLHKKVHRMVLEKVPQAEKVIICPTYRFFQWRVAVITRKKYFVVRAYRDHIKILDEYDRLPLPDHPIMKAAQKDKNIAAFLSFSPVYHWEIREGKDYFEVRFTDLRYRSRGHYPFVAIVHLSRDFQIRTSYTGWIYSKEKLKKKLQVVPD